MSSKHAVISCLIQNGLHQKKTQRFYVFTRLQLGDELKKIHDDLFGVYADLAVPYNTCARWVRQFKDRRKLLTDKPHPGVPKSKVNALLQYSITLITYIPCATTSVDPDQSAIFEV
jgi:transposase